MNWKTKASITSCRKPLWLKYQPWAIKGWKLLDKKDKDKPFLQILQATTSSIFFEYAEKHA